MSNLIEDDDMTEVRNANIPRVDLVDKAANGTSWLIMKAESPNLISTEMVEDLLKQAEEPPMKEAVTVDTVAKADDEILVTDGVSPLDATTPGSAGWETIDAQTAEEVYAQIVRLKNMLDLLAGREATEAATGDSEDAENAWNLEDAAGALDYAGDVVAVYAAGENAEAEEADSVAKALSVIPGEALSTVELFGRIKKAGRTLSAANEQKLVSASESIQSVLASLPAAPEDVTKKGATVSDQETTTEPTVEALVKADEAPAKTAVFNAAGKLVGIVDPAAIEPITGATVDDTDAGDDTEDAPADAAAAPVAPEPVDPNAPIAKTADPEDAPLTKAAVEDLIKGALDTARAEDAAVIKGLTDQVEFLKAPARSKVNTNGAVGVTATTRDGEVVTAGLQKSAEDLRKASASAPDTHTKTAIDNERQSRAVAMLSTLGRAV